MPQAPGSPSMDGDESEYRHRVSFGSLMVAGGVILLVGAVVLIVVEAHLSTGGLLGTVGAAAAIGGLALLLAAAGAGALLTLIVVAGLALGATAALLPVRRRLALARGARPRTGREALAGHVGEVRSIGGRAMQVFVDGALWRAELGPVHPDDVVVHAGDRVVVEHVNGLTLQVRKAEEWELVR
jgi:membrane-bound ClpP family serine protease